MWLIKKAKVIDPSSNFHLSIKDILVEDGLISAIEDEIANGNHQIISFENQNISTGWMDIGVYLGEPGSEHRDTLASLNESCKLGGFTCVATYGNEHNLIDSKNAIIFLGKYFNGKAIDILPIGAITVGSNGKELTELYDLKTNGAIAFCDSNKTIQDSGLLLRALEYCKIFDGLIIQQATDQHLARGGQMHEGNMSTNLGLKGIPSIAEEIILERDLKLIKYLGAKIHFSNISTKEGVEIIKNAKNEGMDVTCSVNFHHLVFTDNDLNEFNSNLKFNPPLRSKSDQKSLWDGLADGTIDYIESGHTPWDVESKEVEFPYAAFGAIGLETIFSAVNTFGKNILSIEQIVEKISNKKRDIFNQKLSIKVGEKANFTLFNIDQEWRFNENNIGSKCKNTPFIGMDLKGKVLGTFINNSFYENK